MMTRTLVACAVALALLTGCSKEVQRDLEQAAEAAGNALDEAGTAIKATATEAARDLEALMDSKSPQRKTFEKDMQTKLLDIEAKLKSLAAEAPDKGAQAAKTVEDLVSDRRKAAMLLEELEKTSQEGYEKAKDVYAKGVEALQEAVDKAEKGL